MAVSFVGATHTFGRNSNYTLLPIHSQAQVGDVLVAHIYTHWFSSQLDLSNGWQHMFPSGNDRRLRSYWKICTAADLTTAYYPQLGIFTDSSAQVIAYRDGDPVAPINPGVQTTAGVDGNYGTYGISGHTTLRNDAMLCATVGAFRNLLSAQPNVVPGVGFTERQEVQYSGSTSTSTAHQITQEHQSRVIPVAAFVSGQAPAFSGANATNWYSTTYSIEPPANTAPGSQSISVPKVAQSRIVIPPTVFPGTTAPIGEGEPDPVAEAGELENETAYAEFETRLTGPPEPIITTVGQNPDQGTIFITWERTDVPDLSFVAYEIAVSNTKFGEKRVARITNPNITEFIYPYPLSGLQHTIKVRQEILEGADLIQSRWAGDDIAVEYDKWFIRDIDDPLNNYIGFDVLSGDNPQIDRQANKTAFRPQGRRLPVHYLGQERSRKGSVTVRVGFHEDERIERLDRLYEVADGRKVCILGLRPSHKIFACLEDPTETLGDRPWISGIDVPWEETEFEEDVILREGR